MKTIDRRSSLQQTIQSGSRPSKVLLKVTVQNNPWPVLLMTSPDSKVEDVIAAATAAYVKESRRPLLQDRDPRAFELHFSQFSLERLNREEMVMNLGSRSFFLCCKSSEVDSSIHGGGGGAEKNAFKILLPLSRFIGVDLRL